MKLVVDEKRVDRPGISEQLAILLYTNHGQIRVDCMQDGAFQLNLG